MTCTDVPTGFEHLAAEQAAIQADKFQGRGLDRYSRLLFPGQEWREPASSDVADFARQFCGEERITLDGLVGELSRRKVDGPLVCADMGGGRGIALRQMAAMMAGSLRPKTINVDVLNPGLRGLALDDIAHLEEKVPGTTDASADPEHVYADIQSVTLAEPADVITSIEVVQYLDNPLMAIANWYNQLATGGLLMVASKHDWANWIRYQHKNTYSEVVTPSEHVLRALQRAGVAHAATYEPDYENGFRPKLVAGNFVSLIVQKLPDTEMRVNAVLKDTWVNDQNYKATYYEAPADSSRPIIDIVMA